MRHFSFQFGHSISGSQTSCKKDDSRQFVYALQATKIYELLHVPSVLWRTVVRLMGHTSKADRFYIGRAGTASCHMSDGLV